MDFAKKKNNGYVKCNEEEATHVFIPKKLYNGYQKAVRIVHDRALQQIDKAQADKNGYSLVRASRKRYGNHYAWQITKKTPYSLKIDLTDVSDLIVNDLVAYYSYHDFESELGINIDTVLYYHDIHKKNGSFDTVSNMQEMQRRLDFLESINWVFSFDLSRISCNYAAGTYEMTYWAIALM